MSTQQVIGKNLRRFMAEEDVSVKMLADWAGRGRDEQSINGLSKV